MQLLGTAVGGRTCHPTSLLMIDTNKGGRGSTSSSRIIPGGFPFLSCQSKFKGNNQYQIAELIKVKWLVTIGFRLQTHHCIIVTTAKLNSYTAFPAHPLSWFWICSLYKLLKQMRKKCCTAQWMLKMHHVSMKQDAYSQIVSKQYKEQTISMLQKNVGNAFLLLNHLFHNFTHFFCQMKVP